MDSIANSNLNVTASLYSFDKAKEVKNNEVLGALGMTPQTQKAQEVIDSSIQTAQAIGQGVSVDFKA